MGSLAHEFDYDLQHDLRAGLATLGVFSDHGLALAAATSGGRVVLHSPQAPQDEDPIRFVNQGKKVTALSAGKLTANADHDSLVVGTATSLMSYDVERNRDGFYKDMSDGVSACVVGRLHQYETPLVFVGGSCSVQGFDAEGEEVMWSVAGDRVGALTFADATGDGRHELIVGTDDYDVKAYTGEEAVEEMTEVEAISLLCAKSPEASARKSMTFGYGLANGSVGVYERFGKRLWRVKSKHRPTAIALADVDADGVQELIVGWDGGKLEVRNQLTGEVKQKESNNHSVAYVGYCDYRGSGTSTVVCALTNGNVHGYGFQKEQAPSNPAEGAFAMKTEEDEQYKKLQAKKAELLSALDTYADQVKKAKDSKGVIPPETRLEVNLRAVRSSGLELSLQTSNHSLIRHIVMQGDNLFDNEACSLHPSPPSQTVVVRVSPTKYSATDLHLRALVGNSASSEVFHVFETIARVPAFAMFALRDYGSRPPAAGEALGKVTFAAQASASSVASWVRDSFALNPRTDAAPTGPASLYSWSFERVVAGPGPEAKLGASLVVTVASEQVTIATDDFELAAEAVASLHSHLQIKECQATAAFPVTEQELRDAMRDVEEHNSVRVRLAGDVAENSQMVKALLTKAEDYRAMGDMPRMLACYARLERSNAELISEHEKRANNHRELLATLRKVNNIIQFASKMRAGAAATKTVAACRASVKSKSPEEVIHAIRTGTAR